MKHFLTGLTGVLLIASLTAVAEDDYSDVEERIRSLGGEPRG